MDKTDDKFIWYRNEKENAERIYKIRYDKEVRGLDIKSAYEALMEDSGDPEINARRIKIIEDYSTENPYSLKAICISYKKPVKFKCSTCGYEWCARLYHKYNKATKCPNCDGQVANEKNNLGQWCEEHGEYGKRLAEEYSPENEQDIWHIAAHSNKKVKWKCAKCGHEWFTWVGNRTASQPRGCSKCLKKNTSKGEQIFLYLLRRHFGDDNVLSQTKIDGYEVDVYVPELKFGIEYGANRWHGLEKKVAYDTRKREHLKEIGLDVLYIIECDRDGDPGIYNDYYFTCGKDFSLEGARKFLKEYFIEKYGMEIDTSLSDDELVKCVDNCLVGDNREFELKVLEKYNQGLNRREISEILTEEIGEEITHSKIASTIKKLKELGLINEEVYKKHFDIIDQEFKSQEKERFAEFAEFYKQGLKYSDIAEKLGVTIPIVHNRVKRYRDIGLLNDDIDGIRQMAIENKNTLIDDNLYKEFISLYVKGLFLPDIADELGISTTKIGRIIKTYRADGRITEEIEQEREENRQRFVRENKLDFEKAEIPDGVEVPEHCEYKVVLTKSQLKYSRFWVGENADFPMELEVNIKYQDTLYRGIVRENHIYVQKQLMHDSGFEVDTGVKLTYSKAENTFTVEVLDEDDEYVIEALERKNNKLEILKNAKPPEVDLYMRYTFVTSDIKYNRVHLGRNSGYNKGTEFKIEYHGNISRAQTDIDDRCGLYLGRDLFRQAGWKVGDMIDIEYHVCDQTIHIKDVTEEDIAEGFDLLDDLL